MANTIDNLGPIAAGKKTVSPLKPSNSNAGPTGTMPQQKQAAEQIAALTPQGSPLDVAQPLRDATTVDSIPDLNKLDPYLEAKAAFDDEVAAEEAQTEQILSDAEKRQLQMSGKAVGDLVEDDAYDLNVPLYAGARYNPNMLKVELKDPNMIARWGNTNSMRQSMLAAQGFTFVHPKDVKNPDTLEMFGDSLGHFVFADLVAMKIPKNIYYAGLRRAYLKSLHATNDKKARQGGAAFAQQALQNSLTGSERSYMAVHKEQTHKDVYTPVVGV